MAPPLAQGRLALLQVVLHFLLEVGGGAIGGITCPRWNRWWRWQQTHCVQRVCSFWSQVLHEPSPCIEISCSQHMPTLVSGSCIHASLSLGLIRGFQTLPSAPQSWDRSHYSVQEDLGVQYVQSEVEPWGRRTMWRLCLPRHTSTKTLGRQTALSKAHRRVQWGGRGGKPSLGDKLVVIL